MNFLLAAAATVAAIAAPLHSVLGERLIFAKLSGHELPELLGSDRFLRTVLRLFWHLVSVAWWGFAAILWLLALLPSLDQLARSIGIIVAWTFLASAIYALITSRGRHFAWGVLLFVGIATWLGVG